MGLGESRPGGYFLRILPPEGPREEEEEDLEEAKEAGEEAEAVESTDLRFDRSEYDDEDRPRRRR